METHLSAARAEARSQGERPQQSQETTMAANTTVAAAEGKERPKSGCSLKVKPTGFSGRLDAGDRGRAASRRSQGCVWADGRMETPLLKTGGAVSRVS